MEVPPGEVSAYGVVKAEAVAHNGSTDRLYRILDLVEKPEPEAAPSIWPSSALRAHPGDLRLARVDQTGCQGRNPVDRRPETLAAEQA